MGVIADLIRAGVDPELIEKVHDELVETAQSAAPMTARQARNARYYDRHGHKRPRGKNWLETAERIKRRDNYTCMYCGGEGETVDHVVAVSAGGSSDDENLACACQSCNSSKSGRSLSEWRGRGK
jgi:5-methylcytosine-specific restriction endonuclease McrA